MHVLPVQGNIYMLVADGTNITASVGADGVLRREHRLGADVRQGAGGDQQLANAVVSTADAEQLLRRELPGRVGLVEPVHQCGHQRRRRRRKPMRYIINTSAAPEHVGGNEKIAAAGFFPRVAAGSARPSTASAVARRSSRTRTCSTR